MAWRRVRLSAKQPSGCTEFLRYCANCWIDRIRTAAAPSSLSTERFWRLIRRSNRERQGLLLCSLRGTEAEPGIYRDRYRAFGGVPWSSRGNYPGCQLLRSTCGHVGGYRSGDGDYI